MNNPAYMAGVLVIGSIAGLVALALFFKGSVQF